MQAGIQRIVLTEAKIGGESITLDQRPQLEIEPKEVINNYTISAQINDLQPTEIEQIERSIYGWLAKFYFLDLSIKTVDKPFFNLQNTEIKTNVSNSRIIKLSTWSKLGLIASN